MIEIIGWILILIIIVLAFIFEKKKKTAEKEALEHLKTSYPKEYQVLSTNTIGRNDHFTVLGVRVFKRPDKLPQDPFLTDKYLEYKKYFIISIALLIIGAVIILFLQFVNSPFA